MNFQRLFRTTEELITPIETSVTGKVPRWLNGTLIRNGPGVFDLDSGFTMTHFHDGFSIISKFTINDGKVHFSKRYLKSKSFKMAERIGKPGVTEFGTRAYADPSRGLLGNAMSNLAPDISDNSNSNIIKLGSRYFAVKCTATMHSINIDDLSIEGEVDLYREMGLSKISPLMRKDEKGSFYTMAISLFDEIEYHLIRIQECENSHLKVNVQGQVICRIPSRWEQSFAAFHTFASTENYVVFIEHPHIAKVTDVKSRHIKGLSLIDCLKWRSDVHNRFYVIEKATGLLLNVKYESIQSFFFLHVINAYEDDEEIVVDVIAHDKPDIIEQTYLRRLRRGNFDIQNVKAARYILPIIGNIESYAEGIDLLKNSNGSTATRRGDTIEVNSRVLCEHGHEFPTINNRYFEKKYRYFYATGYLFRGVNAFSVIKIDTESGKVSRWYSGFGQIPSEATFVERPNPTQEDDGVLLVSVTTSLPGETDKFVVLDASTMQLIASATVSSHVPITFHGLFAQK